MRILITLSAVAAVLFACSGGEKSASKGGSTLTVQRLDSALGYYRAHSGVEESARRVVRTPDDWKRTWGGIIATSGDGVPVPAVDFTKEMVVVAAMGTTQSGGFAITIESAEQSASEIMVHVRNTTPGAGCASLVMLSPVDVVRIPRSDLPVRFVEDTTVKVCD